MKQGIPIKVGTCWRYCGPGDGQNQLHRVIAVDADGITTTTYLDEAPRQPGQPGKPGGLTHSWLGTVEEFHESFLPAQ